jgi:hypothetical protein
MRNPGTLAKMEDGRLVVIFNAQPLLKEKKKVIVYLLNESYEFIKENGKPKTLLFDLDNYNQIIKKWTACGKVD